jgi:hypothetical protein
VTPVGGLGAKLTGDSEPSKLQIVKNGLNCFSIPASWIFTRTESCSGVLKKL